MHSPSFARYEELIVRDDWRGVGELMLESVDRLARAGADFVICPDNTIHQALPFIEERSPLPWLHIARVVAEEASKRGFRRLGLTGTRWLVVSEVYPGELSARGLDYARPSDEAREEMNRIIMDELVYGVAKPEGVEYFRAVIDGMKAEGCDAVILGCTEIPLIINDANSALPTLDSTRLLARAALDYACRNFSSFDSAAARLRSG
jgi:aspartate racemase